MIHNITIPWPNQDLAVELGLKEVKGDTILFNIYVDVLDLSDYKIRAEVYGAGSSIKLANLAAGGSDDEIVDIEAESGMSGFQVIVAAGLTDEFPHYGKIEVEIEDDGNIFTILKQQITFRHEKIDWDTHE